MFVKVIKVCGYPPYYTVSARFPDESNPEDLFKDIWEVSEWPIKVEHHEGKFWSVIFPVSVRDAGEDAEQFEEWCQ